MESGKIEWRGGLRRVWVGAVVAWGVREHITGPRVFVLGQCRGILPSVGGGGRGEVTAILSFPKSALPLKEKVPSITGGGVQIMWCDTRCVHPGLLQSRFGDTGVIGPINLLLHVLSQIKSSMLHLAAAVADGGVGGALGPL